MILTEHEQLIIRNMSIPSIRMGTVGESYKNLSDGELISLIDKVGEFIILATDKSSEIDFNKEEYLKHLSKDVFTVKCKERSTGKILEINPKADLGPFYDTLYRNLFRSGEYILISGELPDKWK